MNHIENIRKDQKMSRTELSRQSGVPLRTLEAWAGGLRIPRDVYQLHKVAKVLGCTIEDLIDPQDGETKESAE